MGNNGRFSDGFLMGAIIGGAAVFLLGTQKGNKVLKMVMDEGRAGLNDLMEEIEDYKEVMKEEAALENEEDIENVDEVVEITPKLDGESHVVKSRSSKRFFRKGK